MPAPDVEVLNEMSHLLSHQYTLGETSVEAYQRIRDDAFVPLANALASKVVESLGDRFDMLSRGLSANMIDSLGGRFDMLEHTIKALFEEAGGMGDKRPRARISLQTEDYTRMKDFSYVGSKDTQKSSKLSRTAQPSQHDITPDSSRFDFKDDFEFVDAPVPGERQETANAIMTLRHAPHPGFGGGGGSPDDSYMDGSKASRWSPTPSKRNDFSKSSIGSDDLLYSMNADTNADGEHAEDAPSKVIIHHGAVPFARKNTVTTSFTRHFGPGSAKDSLASLDFDSFIMRVGLFGRCCNRNPRAIRPESSIRVCFDLLSLVILLYDAITIPFILAWDPDMRSPFFILFWITPAFWTCDMMLNFVTGYYVEDAELELDLRKTSLRYSKTRFPVDLAVNAVDWFFIVIESDKTLAPLRVFKSNRLIRLLSIFRMARIWLRMTQFRHWLYSDTWHMLTSIVKLFFIILYLNHCIACTWYGLGVWRSQSDTGVTWLNTEDELTLETFVNASPMYQYTTGLHWAMTQMTPGSMEVFPKNSVERIFNIMCLLNGLLFGTSLISQLSAKMIQLQLTKQEQLKNLLLLRRYIRQENISASLGARVVNDVKRCLTVAPRLRSDNVPYLNQISGPLKAELRFELFSPHLLKDPMFFMFDTLDRSVLRDICLALEMIYLQPGDHLFHHGVQSKDAYIVSRGKLQYTYASSSRASVIPGDLTSERSDKSSNSSAVIDEVGPDEWISKVALWSEWKTKGTAIAVMQSDLIRLSYSRLSKAVAHHYKIDTVWDEYVKAFSISLSYLPNVMINDLDSNVEMGDVVMQMRLQSRLMLAHAVFKYLRKNERGKWIMLSVGFGGVSELEQEVRSGKCLLLLNEERTPERIAFLSALSIARPDGRILVQVASYKRGTFEAACQLPGLKREDGEEPPDTIKRIITKRLWGLKAVSNEDSVRAHCKLAVNACERQHKNAVSKNFQLNTKYLLNVYTLKVTEQDAVWDETLRDVAIVELAGMLRKFGRRERRRSGNSSHSGGRDWSQGSMRLIRDKEGKDGIVYAWLVRDEFEHLCSHSDDLASYVGQMTLDLACASN